MNINLVVTAMHCEHCCGTVESALMVVPGFVSCKVELGVVEIVFDETTSRKSDLLAALRRAGAFNIERFEAVN